MNRSNCRCLGCTKRPQKEITEDLKRRGIFPDALQKVAALSFRKLTGPIVSLNQPKETPTQNLDPASPTYMQSDSGSGSVNHDCSRPTEATVCNFSPHTRQDSEGRETHRESSSTLQTIQTSQSTQATDPPSPLHTQPRSESWFRIGELVYILLERPIQTTSDFTPTTRIWPAIVLDVVPTGTDCVKSPEAIIGTEHDRNLVIQLLGFGSLTSVITVKQQEARPYYLDLDSSLFIPDSSHPSSDFEANVPSLAYEKALQGAHRMALTWAITDAAEAKFTNKLEDAGSGIPAQSVRWGE
ncbi:hypothetical protein V5O48_009908 [Marasmius crinis-equi]|uniref:Uncharacterized protein n=1 Tax=Marasmius crinis-equi TaxID=585013 RepID=A0ABR3F9V4_9AGAR